MMFLSRGWVAAKVFLVSRGLKYVNESDIIIFIINSFVTQRGPDVEKILSAQSVYWKIRLIFFQLYIYIYMYMYDS
jgi:hypothetical protein